MKKVLVYTMKNCPYCINVKKMLKENKIDFLERDIEEFQDEYSRFVKKTKNDYLPAFTLLEMNEDKKEIIDMKFLLPDESFKDIKEAVEKVSKFLLD
jgi:glutaredoxin